MVSSEEREKLKDRHVAVQLGVKMDVRTKPQMHVTVASIAACRKSQWEIQLERLKRVEWQLYENPMPTVEDG